MTSMAAACQHTRMSQPAKTCGASHVLSLLIEQNILYKHADIKLAESYHDRVVTELDRKMANDMLMVMYILERRNEITHQLQPPRAD